MVHDIQLESEVEVVERRARVQQTIDHLLRSREQMLVNYALLAGMPSDTERHGSVAPQCKMLQPFLQQLVDYLALGHFELYQRIKEGSERRQRIRDAANRYFPTLLETTEFLVEFNDKYDAFDAIDVNAEELDALSSDLRKVGQILHLRSEIEDAFLSSMRS